MPVSGTPVTPPPGAPPPGTPLPAPAPAVATTPAIFHSGDFSVDPTEGRNNFTAVFDAPLGERITATSSKVSCNVTYDEKASTFSGTCSVPLESIMVDSDSTKAEHFREWSTNKKSNPKTCTFEAKFDSVKLASSIHPGTMVPFSGEAPFTICGRARVDGGKEHITGNISTMPDSSTLRVRAQIDGFNRDKYHIGPAYTEGWLARVQKLAPVVADTGTINLALFAEPK